MKSRGNVIGERGLEEEELGVVKETFLDYDPMLVKLKGKVLG